LTPSPEMSMTRRAPAKRLTSSWSIAKPSASAIAV
jgi:hypothetical protein